MCCYVFARTLLILALSLVFLICFCFCFCCIVFEYQLCLQRFAVQCFVSAQGFVRLRLGAQHVHNNNHNNPRVGFQPRAVKPMFLCPFQGRTLTCSPIFTLTTIYIFVGSYPSLSLHVLFFSFLRPVITVMVYWALKINYLCFYLSFSICFPFFCSSLLLFFFFFVIYTWVFFLTSQSSFLRHFPLALLISILDICENGCSKPLSTPVTSR